MTVSDEAAEAAAKAYQAEFPYDENEAYIVKLILEAAAPFIRAQALSEFAAESQERSDTFMKTMQHMADSREYSADDVLQYAAYSAEANTTAYRLRARAAAERGGEP